MSKRISNYKSKWNTFFENWLNSPQEVFENDIWGKGHTGKGKTELDPFSLPQPYLGNPNDCSVITLNLNPGPTSDLRIYKDGMLVKKFSDSENYFEYAKSFPQMNLENHPSRFWIKQFKWIDSIIGSDIKHKLPFAIEICPWHSKKWKALKKISPELNTYIRENVFDIISEAIHCSAIKTVLSVGKTYYDLFGLESLGFKKLIDVTPENYLNINGLEWPMNKKGQLSKRYFSIWEHKETGIMYFNTYSLGSNTPPSDKWNDIQDYLLKNYS